MLPEIVSGERYVVIELKISAGRPGLQGILNNLSSRISSPDYDAVLPTKAPSSFAHALWIIVMSSGKRVRESTEQPRMHVMHSSSQCRDS